MVARTEQKRVVMVCTAARGGMRSVIDGYRADGLFSRWRVISLSPHVEGGLAARLLAAAKEFFRLGWLLVTRQVGLLHCHAAMKGSFWRKSIFALVSRAFGVPVIFHIHGGVMKAFVSRQPALVRKFMGWVLARQTRVLMLSESWSEYVRRLSPNANVVTLPNYVVLPDLAAKRGVEEGGDVNVLFLGVVGAAKGVYDLLPAFKQALAASPRLRLLIAGNGEIERARAMAEALAIGERVVFVGWVDGEAKVDLFRRAQICVLPSYNEGLPVCLLEAMSWQMPVIATRVGGIPDLVRDGVDGVLIEPGDKDALAEALVRLSSDRGAMVSMGRAARERIEWGFSKDVVLPKLETIYRSVLAGRA